MGENERAKIKRARDIPHITQLEAWKMEMLFSRRFYGFVLKINHKIRRCAFLQETTIPATHTHTHKRAQQMSLFIVRWKYFNWKRVFYTIVQVCFYISNFVGFCDWKKEKQSLKQLRWEIPIHSYMSHATCLMPSLTMALGKHFNMYNGRKVWSELCKRDKLTL